VRKALRTIDAISDFTGRSVKWLAYAIILIMVFDVSMRYAFNAPTMWAYETVIMVGAAMYVLAWSYTHRHEGHVRVDVIYSQLSRRGRAIIDVFGGIVFFLPLAATLIYTSAFWTIRAWQIKEVLTEGYWYPPLTPLRFTILLGVCLFTLQGSAKMFRDIYVLIRNQPYD
jgi:TRAP-type mannitol/chloroaromatic compound transport system permease small subunit